MEEYLDQTFEKVNFTQQPLKKGNYDNCQFLNCDLSGSNLSGITFIDCQFSTCNLSMALLGATVFRDVVFKGCKMTGLHFDHCSDFGLAMTFDQCTLDYSSFYQKKLKKMRFQQCQLKEADFTDADLTSSVFDHCELIGTKFDNTVLEKTDFRTAYNYAIDPERNKIKKARFALPEVIGLLAKYDIDISRG